MKKEKKQILYIFTFLILGCVIGYFVAVTQMKQVNDPEYIAFWASQDMLVPEPIGFPRSIISCLIRHPICHYQRIGNQ